MIKRGSWIEVEDLVHLSKGLTVKIFTRGCCLSDCDIGEMVEVKIITGHVAKGIVSKDRPLYNSISKLGKDTREVLMIST